MAIHKILGRVRRAVSNEIWNIGVIEQPALDIVMRGILSPVRWLRDMPPFSMLADPSCCISEDGSLQLFAEFLDYRTPRGEIWSAKLSKGADLSGAILSPLLSTRFHMSYPMPFRDTDGVQWLMAESWQSGHVPLWRLDGCEPTPGLPWLEGHQAVDPTLIHHSGRWYLFCTFRNDGPDDRLHLFHAERLDGKWQPVKGNPVCKGRFGSRPAGAIITDGADMFRPGQDSSVTYGGGIVLHRISRLDPEGYAEEFVRRLGPIEGDYDSGLHTICAAGAMTLIDGKRWERDFSKPLRQFTRKAFGVNASYLG